LPELGRWGVEQTMGVLTAKLPMYMRFSSKLWDVLKTLGV